MKRSRHTTGGPAGTPSITRVRDVVAEAELAKQRARLYSRARLFIAIKYSGNADPTVQFDAIERVATELLVAANNEAQLAERLLGQLVSETPVGRQRSSRGRKREA